MEVSTCLETLFHDKIKYLQDLIVDASSTIAEWEQQLNIIKTLNELKNNELFSFYFCNNQFIKSSSLKALEILLKSRSNNGHMIKYEACRFLINLLEKTSFGDIKFKKDNDLFLWQKQLYEQFFTSTASLINDLVLDNDKLFISTLYPIVVYCIKAIETHKLIERKFICNYLEYLINNAEAYPVEYDHAMCTVITELMFNKLNYNNIARKKQDEFIKIFKTLKKVFFKMNELKFHKPGVKMNEFYHFLELIARFQRSSPFCNYFKHELALIHFDVMDTLFYRVKMAKKNFDELEYLKLFHGTLSFSYSYFLDERHSDILYQIFSDPIHEVALKAVELMMNILKFDVFENSVFNCKSIALEIMFNIAISIPSNMEGTIMREIFIRICWSPIKVSWLKKFLYEDHENCTYKMVDFFVANYDPQYSDDIKFFLEKFSELLKHECTREKTLMRPQTLNSLRNLFRINDEHNIVTSESCYEIFELQMELIEKCVLSIFLEIGLEFYSELLHGYPGKKDYFLERKTVWTNHLKKLIPKFAASQLSEDVKAVIIANKDKIVHLTIGIVGYLGDENLSEDNKIILDNVLGLK